MCESYVLPAGWSVTSITSRPSGFRKLGSRHKVIRHLRSEFLRPATGSTPASRSRWLPIMTAKSWEAGSYHCAKSSRFQSVNIDHLSHRGQNELDDRRFDPAFTFAPNS